MATGQRAPNGKNSILSFFTKKLVIVFGVVAIVLVAIYAFWPAGSYKVVDRSGDLRMKSEAEGLYNKGKHKKALPKLTKYLRTNPDDIEARGMLAGSYMLSGELEKAIEQYESILKIDSDDADTRYKLGILLRQVGRVDQAVIELKRAAKQKPSQQFLSELAKTYAQKDRLKEAVSSWNKALEFTAGNTNARVSIYTDMGDAYMRMESRGKAKEAYRSGLDLDPNNDYLKTKLSES